MKRVISVLFLLCVSCPLLAAPEPLSGQFTHDFTRTKNASVWTVKKSGTEWRVFVHGSKGAVPATKVSEAERKAFWEKMWWPAEKAKDAQCLSLGDEWQGMMCYVHRSARAEVEELAKKKSDYFYYDQMAGLMEIRYKGK